MQYTFVFIRGTHSSPGNAAHELLPVDLVSQEALSWHTSLMYPFSIFGFYIYSVWHIDITLLRVHYIKVVSQVDQSNPSMELSILPLNSCNALPPFYLL